MAAAVVPVSLAQRSEVKKDDGEIPKKDKGEKRGSPKEEDNGMTDKKEPRVKNVAAVGAVNTVPRVLAGHEVFATAAAVLLPGGAAVGQKESGNAADIERKEKDDAMATDGKADADSGKTGENIKSESPSKIENNHASFQLTDPATNSIKGNKGTSISKNHQLVEHKSSQYDEGKSSYVEPDDKDLGTVEDTDKAAQDAKVMEEIQTKTAEMETSKYFGANANVEPDDKDLGTVEDTDRAAQHAKVMEEIQTKTAEMETSKYFGANANEPMETMPPQSSLEVHHAGPLVFNKQTPSKAPPDNKTLTKSSDRPKSTTVQSAKPNRPSSKTASMKYDQPKSSLVKSNFSKNESPQNSNTPKPARAIKGKDETSRSKTPIATKVENTDSKANAPHTKVATETKTSKVKSEKSSEQQVKPKQVRPPSTTTIISHTSSIRSAGTAPTKSPTPSYSVAAGTKLEFPEVEHPQALKAPPPPPPRTSTPNRQVRSETKTRAITPSTPKTQTRTVAFGTNVTTTRVKSATPGKREHKDPRDAHNPFADRRAATKTPLAVVRPEDIARIKSAANKQLVHDFKLKTVRAPAPDESPVRGRSRENKKVAVPLVYSLQYQLSLSARGYVSLPVTFII